MSDVEDWQKPMRPLPGPVASEGSQMSTRDRDLVVRDGSRAAHEFAGHTTSYDECAQIGPCSKPNVIVR